jgi:nascent polypeptide-associated complex subunit alpha
MKGMETVMIPGLGGINPKKMQAMMKQMGIKQDEIEAERVIIEKSDGKIIIDNPNVQKIVMQGQESWQITGNSTEEDNSEKDIDLIVEKTGKSGGDAKKALEETGDIAEAILKLSSL